MQKTFSTDGFKDVPKWAQKRRVAVEAKSPETKVDSTLQGSKSQSASEFRRKSAVEQRSKTAKKKTFGAKMQGDEDHTRMNYDNLPARWFHDDESSKKQKAMAPYRPQPARPFPPHMPATRRMRHFGAGEGNDPRVQILRVSDIEDVSKNFVDYYSGFSSSTATVAADDEDFLKLDMSKMSLEQFDDPSVFESKSPSEWVSVKATGQIPYYSNGEWVKTSCEVKGYDELAKKFIVAVGEDKAKEKAVGRLNLQFDDEEPRLYEERIKRAREFREKAKANIRYDYFLENQAEDSVEAIPDWVLDDIAKRIGGSLANETPLLNDLVDDVASRYARACKKIVLNVALKQDEDMRSRYELLKLPPPPEKERVPEFGIVIIPKSNVPYQKISNKIAKKIWLRNPGVRYSIVHHYHRFTDDFDGSYMCSSTKPTAPVELEDFAATQATSISTFMSLLNEKWRRTLADNLLDNCNGYFNFYESEVENFEGNTLHTFLHGLRVRMSDQLRDILEFNTSSWQEQVLHMTKLGTKDEAGFGMSAQPVLRFTLNMEEGTGLASIMPPTKDVQNVMVGVIDQMVTALCSLTTIDQELMTLLSIRCPAILDLSKETYATVNANLECIKVDIAANVSVSTLGHTAIKTKFEKAAFLLQTKTSEAVAEFAKTVPEKEIEAIVEELRKYVVAADTVNRCCSNVEKFSIGTIDTTASKAKLLAAAEEHTSKIIDAVLVDAKTRFKEVESEYEAIVQIVSREPKTEMELVKLKTYVDSLGSKVLGLKKRVNNASERLGAMGEFGFRLPYDVFKTSWNIRKWPTVINDAFADAQAAIRKMKKRMATALEKDQKAFRLHVEALGKRAIAYVEIGGSDPERDYDLAATVDEAINVDTALKAALEKADEFNARETAFGYEPEKYHDEINRYLDDFLPYFELWTMFGDFYNNVETWLQGPFLKLNAKDIGTFVTTAWQKSYKMKAKLKDKAPKAAEVAATLREKTDAFKKNVPLLEALGSKALLDRHWFMLSEAIEHDIIPDMDLTLQSLVDIDIMSQWDKVEEITTIANKEDNLLQKLTSMEQSWEEVDVFCKHYLKKGQEADENTTHIIMGTDEIYALLDDQIVLVQTMLGSPFIKYIKKQTVAFERKLVYAQELLDEWLAVQRTWMYLEPIFGSEDIMRQMPAEGRRFALVDTFWRKNMKETVDMPRMMHIAGKEELLGQFKGASKKLDVIQKGLEEYLEVKRLAFSRFFFLSNDELLEILSQTKDPRAVQPYLNKCFEGVAKVTFRGEVNGNEKDAVIIEMQDSKGETVPLSIPIDPNEGQNKGNVENWLLEMQSSMRITLKDQLKLAIEQYPQLPRTEWAVNWPGQVVLNVSMLYWTTECEQAIVEKGLAGLKVYKENLMSQIGQIVEMVKGKMSKQNRTTVRALCTLDVHAKNSVDEMIAQEVSTNDAFEWLSQLRFTWENKPDDYCRYGDDVEPMNLIARILNASQMYGYEYIGNQGRLVVTPLTDRCYRTLMGAVSLMFGGAPAGPAGTGKTETVKDLSKGCAIQCVVLNCSPEFDYKAMGKFFKGLAQSGSWSCFDEFNRIILEVLSVIAQQILTLQIAKRTRVKTFEFEGTTLTLNPDANVFITMNPGYAGRQELPDNLKALFRPCAMMVPDYALISEVMLFSMGFNNATPLARKLTQVLKLASELLSSQCHYDYGMRAVFSILVRAGSLLLKLQGSLPEADIVLSAITDVNLPKFTTNDIPLFTGITSDLFPGLELPVPDYGDLVTTMTEVTKDLGLQPTPSFIRSVIQLYETVAVRHGLMIVGQAFAGKTGILRVLAETLRRCEGENFPPDVKVVTINPKSVASTQLYGAFDPSTHEWEDGVLAIQYRNLSKILSGEKVWMMFDGPVDTLWIESMNTVLDDNKKLCLTSGEIVKMSPYMTMMFEPEDLEVASPATVSRVGVVFMEPGRLGWEPLLRSWLDKLPASLIKHRDTIEGIYNWLMLPSLFFVRQYTKVPTPITVMEMANNTMTMMSCLLETPFVNTPEKCPSDKDVPKWMENVTILSLIWSVGGVTDTAGRKIFDDLFRQTIMGTIQQDERWKLFVAKNPGYTGDCMSGRHAVDSVPESGSVYDYKFDMKKGKWESWMPKGKSFQVEKDIKYADIIIPTIDTIRTEALVQMMVLCGRQVLVTGETGTGKSAFINNMIDGILDKTKFTPIFVNFSAQTTANQTQDIIDGKLGKRRKGVFGPSPGFTATIFVDDLNMPKKEEYGAQPPIEILRAWMDHNGWWDRHDPTWAFKSIVNVQFIAAMGPPGGGKTQITSRYVRHFNMINIVPFDAESLKIIFSAICTWFLADFGSSIKKMGDSLVSASAEVYNEVNRVLLPTPIKSHYTYNLRDLSKVFQGLASANGEIMNDSKEMIRLWGHECSRVFRDRLINEEDRGKFDEMLEHGCKDNFRAEWKDVKGKQELIFGNFLDPQIDRERRNYIEFTDHKKLEEVMNAYLEDYNNMFPKPMDLVLFLNAIEHCARIARIIQQPMGNALLVGVGGSGRKSLTTLAVYIADMTLYEIEITKVYNMTEWREDLKTVLKMAGAQLKPTVFLFSDTQIKREDFVEDINNILNTGEVPNLFAADEKNEICELLSKPAEEAGMKDANQIQLLKWFVKNCRQNLHICLAFSPVGSAFRSRLRMFPSLINSSTIDWFLQWPDEALRSVALFFLKSVELGDEERAAVVETCVDMQMRVTKMTHLYLEELRRYYYVTPTSYLALIKTFKSLIGTKRDEVSTRRDRYQNGLTKILETAEQVEGMQVELEALQPKLKVAQKETAEKLVIVTAEEEVVSVQVAAVDKIVAACDITKRDAASMKHECESMLAVAIPALKAAEKALNSLTKGDITEVKAMKNPPHGVRVTMEAVCLMYDLKPARVKDPDNPSRKINDYWPTAQKLLNDSKFLSNLLIYDRDNIAPEIVEKVGEFCQRDDFTPEIVKKASKAASGLCQWVHAMIMYDKVAKEVEPKRIALAKASEELAAAEIELAAKQAELKIVQDNLDALQAELKKTMDYKNQLEFDVKQCAARLDSAEKLISGLGGERDRWRQFVEDLTVQYGNITGDIVLSSGLIAYMGCFVKSYREDAIHAWSDILRSKNITCADTFSIVETLGKPVQIRQWNIEKLPNDQFSIANAIMIGLSDRWPLMIDPQMQANKWIKIMETKNQLKVCKQSQSTFVRTIENSIQFGCPCLLENVPETIDPILESVLLKQIVKVGGTPSIKLGDNLVAYEDGFRLYMTSRLPNPHYAPETVVKVNLLNFMATEDGLMDQMLGVTVKQERPDLEEKMEQLILEDAANKSQLKEIEDNILELLAKAEGNILDDAVLIETLSQSKITSNKIEKAVAAAVKVTKTINDARKLYEVVAFRVSQLFFCIADLAMVDPMYQYSLDWYLNLFLLAIQKSEVTKKLDVRLKSLIDTFTEVLYVNVCRSLFEKTKLLFSFLLCTKVYIGEKKMKQNQLKYFLSGNTAVDLAKPNPNLQAGGDQWLENKAWADLLGIENVGEEFAGMSDDVSSDLSAWKTIFESDEPISLIRSRFPRLDNFQHLMITRCIRPDKCVPELTLFVENALGPQFVDPPTFDLKVSYEVSTCETPIIFVLTSGADPMTVLNRLAVEMDMNDDSKFLSLSLGQGQGPRAERAIAQGRDKGLWVCLQNCDLGESFLPTLEKLCEEITTKNTHADFRMWLTTMPFATFPVSVLQNGVKMTLEPPRGMRQSLQGSFTMIQPEWLEDSRDPKSLKKLVFALCFFHATVSERIKFGPLGWNITYGFSTPDLSISLDQLKLFVDEYNEIPYRMLNYCVGECNYGGRVTDDKDRRCIKTILSFFYTENEDIMDDNYRFSKSGLFYAPPDGDHASIMKFIRSLPLLEGPECYGLHDNAAITSAILETTRLLGTALELQPRSAGGAGETWEEKLARVASDIEQRMPMPFDLEAIAVAYPTVFENSMNTILTQESERFDNLLRRVRTTLRDSQRAILGEVLMSEELEQMGNSLVNGLVPTIWMAVSYPSLKPIGGYVADFLERLAFINRWVAEDSPTVFWISGFFFTQSFLTGTRQNYARKTGIAIDLLSYDFQVVEDGKELTELPPQGAYINGLFLQGAKWDPVAPGCSGGDGRANGGLVNSDPRVLYMTMPQIWLMVKETDKIDPLHIYVCPTYKTSIRQGMLTTTGASTNFVMMIHLPMLAESVQSDWIKAGVAMLCALDD
jgi:dynein heavy chain